MVMRSDLGLDAWIMETRVRTRTRARLICAIGMSWLLYAIDS
jgi:hypothetical protein